MQDLAMRDIRRRRAAAHRLFRRMPRSQWMEAAALCGVQNTPPGTAAEALWARVEGFRPDDLAAALRTGVLLQSWSLRAAPYLYPAADQAVFTLGVLPRTEADLRSFLPGLAPAWTALDLPAQKLLSWLLSRLQPALEGREVTRDELGIALAQAMEPKLSPRQLDIWRGPSWISDQQTFGQSAARFLAYAAALTGRLCHAPRTGRAAAFRLSQPPVAAPQAAARTLAGRFVQAYGPVTPQDLAAWMGVSRAQARAAWDGLPLVAVPVAGRTAFVAAGGPEPAVGEGHALRLLPPHDPYLQGAPKGQLVADDGLRQALFRTSGNPGAVLRDGEIVGLWRKRSQGQTLAVQVTLAASLSPREREALAEEAQSLADFWGKRLSLDL